MFSHTVTFQPAGAKVSVDEECYPCGDTGRPGSILDIALTHGVGIEHACGGMGVCGRCRVTVEAGAENLSEVDEDEVDTLDSSDPSGPDDRLACLAVVHGDVTVQVTDQA